MRSLAKAPAQAPGIPPAVQSTASRDVAAERETLDRLHEQAREIGAAEGRREGWTQGQAEGHAAGLAAGRADVEVRLAQWDTLLRALPQAIALAEVEVSESLAALAVDIARQVVHRTLQVEPEWIVRVVQELLHEEPSLQGEPRMLLNPLDVDLVSSALGAELQSLGWQVRADESISRGGCLVQSTSGSRDATLETRWARVIASVDLKPAGAALST